jgi:hypothetical protein
MKQSVSARGENMKNPKRRKTGFLYETGLRLLVICGKLLEQMKNFIHTTFPKLKESYRQFACAISLASNWTIGITTIFGTILTASCSTVKKYEMTSKKPNLVVDVQMEEKMLVSTTADLFIQEMRGPCSVFFHGLIDLENGVNNITLPVGKELLIEFTRVNATFNARGASANEFRFTPEAGHVYRFQYRERRGSQELTLEERPSESGKFKELRVRPKPECKKWDFKQ